MHHDFWHQRWQENQIGFHQAEVNSFLTRHWPELSIPVGGRVLVPLCGKSKDMLWLRDLGYSMLGVELSQVAVEAFFNENALQASVSSQGEFLCYDCDGLRILCGDFFALTAEELGEVDVVYDRGALVALPEELRVRYVSSLYALLNSQAEMLLVVFDYPQAEMPGPPFSISRQEIEALYSHWCGIQLLSTENALESQSQFKARGLSRMDEHCYRLSVR